MEAILGHHGAQDLSDRFGRFGFQPHRAVNRYQVQSRSEERAQVNISIDINRDTERTLRDRSKRDHSYLNKVRFSILKSRELRVRQSWSNTKG